MTHNTFTSPRLAARKATRRTELLKSILYTSLFIGIILAAGINV